MASTVLFPQLAPITLCPSSGGVLKRFKLSCREIVSSWRVGGGATRFRSLPGLLELPRWSLLTLRASEAKKPYIIK